jgi:hypothetical protein
MDFNRAFQFLCLAAGDCQRPRLRGSGRREPFFLINSSCRCAPNTTPAGSVRLFPFRSGPANRAAVVQNPIEPIMKKLISILFLTLASSAFAADLVNVSTNDAATPSSNTAAVVTYAAAGANVSHVINGIAWSYSAAPTAGNLKIEDGSGNVVFSIDITSAGAGFFPFPAAKKGTANTAMIVTLAAGGSAVTGKVSVLCHWTQQ